MHGGPVRPEPTLQLSKAANTTTASARLRTQGPGSPTHGSEPRAQRSPTRGSEPSSPGPRGTLHAALPLQSPTLPHWASRRLGSRHFLKDFFPEELQPTVIQQGPRQAAAPRPARGAHGRALGPILGPGRGHAASPPSGESQAWPPCRLRILSYTVGCPHRAPQRCPKLCSLRCFSPASLHPPLGTPGSSYHLPGVPPPRDDS